MRTAAPRHRAQGEQAMCRRRLIDSVGRFTTAAKGGYGGRPPSTAPGGCPIGDQQRGDVEILTVQSRPVGVSGGPGNPGAGEGGIRSERAWPGLSRERAADPILARGMRQPGSSMATERCDGRWHMPGSISEFVALVAGLLVLGVLWHALSTADKASRGRIRMPERRRPVRFDKRSRTRPS